MMTICGMDAFSWNNLSDEEKENQRKLVMCEGEYSRNIPMYDAYKMEAVHLIEELGYQFKGGKWQKPESK